MGAGSLSELSRGRSQLVRVGFVAALAAEARSLAPLKHSSTVDICMCGMGVAAAATAASALADAGATALVSWGFAGALDETFPSGTLFVPSRVLFAGREFYPESAWRERVCRALAASEEGTLVTYAVPLTNAREKRSAFDQCGARAVDMESAAVARVAHERGLPFLAIKAVLDGVTDSIPAFAATAVAADGKLSGSKFMLSLLRRPTCLPQCWRLLSMYRRALRTLDSAAIRLQPILLDASRSTAV